jgi:hypothetical protein
MKYLRTILFSVVVCLLSVLPSWAIIGDISGMVAYEPSCNCYATWQVVSVNPVSPYQADVFYAVSFPDGGYFVTGPVSVFY